MAATPKQESVSDCADRAQTGLIVKHEDRWNNKGFKMPGFLKKPNGIFTSSVFKLIGWGRQEDKAGEAAKTGAQ